jgi:hypothetical protein
MQIEEWEGFIPTLSLIFIRYPEIAKQKIVETKEAGKVLSLSVQT